MTHQPRILFLSHGGGPLPLLGDAQHQEMVACLQTIRKQLKKPSCILVISAHWEESVACVTSGAHPPLIYDYFGFPKPAYDIEYPCPGDPVLAQRIHDQLQNHDIRAKMDEQRGLDHGVFVPLKIMFPEADIACVQLSLLNHLDAPAHLSLGKALANLNIDNLLVIGSGFSFHNMQAFFSGPNPAHNEMNASFEQWLIDTCSNPNLDEATRSERLAHWDSAPFARFCHPRQEHLLPLHVCYGMAQAPCSAYFELTILGKKTSMYLW